MILLSLVFCPCGYGVDHIDCPPFGAEPQVCCSTNSEMCKMRAGRVCESQPPPPPPQMPGSTDGYLTRTENPIRPGVIADCRVCLRAAVIHSEHQA